MVQLLIDNGASLTERLRNGDTPLTFAVVSNKRRIASLLLDHKDTDKDACRVNGCTSLWLAASKGFVELATVLVERGADVSLTREDGTTPLMAAALGGHTVVCHLVRRARARARCARVRVRLR